MSVLTARLLLLACVGLGNVLALPVAAAAPATVAEQTRGMTAQPGFADVWRDADQGRVLLSVQAKGEPFLLVVSMPHGLGSNDVGIDRGKHAGSRLVHFERRGKRVFLVEQNTRFVANSSNPDERASAVEAFAPAVLWAGDVLASDGGKVLIDFSSFMLQDWNGVAESLKNAKQGAYSIDEKRSAIVAESARSFPDNTELEAILTFKGAGEGEYVRQVAADPASLTLRQHVSLVRLPGAGFTPRPYHPYSGGLNVNFVDFSTPLTSSLNVGLQPRFRLEKTDPSAPVSTVRKPIVFYVDRGAPEPVRSALLEGARWWTTAFEKAGFRDAYRVELLPEGVDPMDIRYNVIQWVHRATRGWSYGHPIIDPRTGEIIKGVVTLGSQRVRQDILIAEALLAPYGKGSARTGLAQQMALARLRQLSAHEVGHTLGIAHNFAASLKGNASVMDYPHPLVKLDARGEVDIADAYGVGVGEWDDYVIRHAYGQFEPAGEAAALARLRAGTRAKGFDFVGDGDARLPGASHPSGMLWDIGGDPAKSWDTLMAVRKRALQTFSVDALPDERQMGEIEARLVPVYLLHRYQTEAIARLLGGGAFDYSTSTDVRAGTGRGGIRKVAPATQRAVLERLASSLQAETLALPANVLDVLTPPGEGFERGREYFATRTGSEFDALSAVQAGAAQTSMYLLEATRMNRLAWQHARDPQQPGVAEVIDTVLQRTWKRGAVPSAVVAGDAVQVSANWVVLDTLLRLAENGNMHPGPTASLRRQLAGLGDWLAAHPAKGAVGQSRIEAADLIRRYLADPSKVKLRAMPAIPPGAPI